MRMPQISHIKDLRVAEKHKMNIDHERFAYCDTSDIVQSEPLHYIASGSNLVKWVKEAHDILN